MSGESTDPIDRAEIIYEKPVSGAFEEILFGSDRGNTLWVRFGDQYGASEWIGKFGWGGWTTVMKVTKVSEPDCFLVVAGGAAYVVDATKKKLLEYYAGGPGQQVVFDLRHRSFVAGDIHLRVIEGGSQVWCSRRISFDYIPNMRIDGFILSGKAVVVPEKQEEDFAFNLDSREFVIGPDLSAWDPATDSKRGRR